MRSGSANLVRTSEASSPFLGVSAAAGRVRAQIAMAAKTKLTVLITGETGVGKELVAREIHSHSSRANAAFVTLNCAAIPEQLLESEIFGHELGAFTDAKKPHRGALERAHEGTLLLDEVGDLCPYAQPKLLRALEETETLRVGGENSRSLDIRFIAATNHSLRAMCNKNEFRNDLYYRLCILEIDVPPLRERSDDIVLLAEHFARLDMSAAGLEFECIERCSLPRMLAHPWPGNVRELRATIGRAIAARPSPRLEIPNETLGFASDPSFSLSRLFEEDWKGARSHFEAAYTHRLLERNDHDVKKAAKAAGIVPRSLYKILRRVGLRP